MSAVLAEVTRLRRSYGSTYDDAIRAFWPHPAVRDDAKLAVAVALRAMWQRTPRDGVPVAPRPRTTWSAFLDDWRPALQHGWELLTAEECDALVVLFLEDQYGEMVSLLLSRWHRANNPRCWQWAERARWL